MFASSWNRATDVRVAEAGNGEDALRLTMDCRLDVILGRLFTPDLHADLTKLHYVITL